MSTENDILKSIHEARADMQKVIDKIYESGNVDYAKCFVRQFGKKFFIKLFAEQCRDFDGHYLDAVLMDTIFIDVCSRGHLDMAQYIADIFEISEEIMRSWDNNAFFSACENDRLEVVQWLVVAARITFNDVCAGDGDFFGTAIIDCNNETIQWVIDEFQITPKDIGLDDPCFFKYLDKYTFGGTHDAADALFQTKSAAKLS
jgi:hypothetical protein